MLGADVQGEDHLAPGKEIRWGCKVRACLEEDMRHSYRAVIFGEPVRKDMKSSCRLAVVGRDGAGRREYGFVEAARI